MRLFVGLGNPGPRYVGTRHNFGYEALDRIAVKTGASWGRTQPAAEAMVAPARLEGEPVLLAKPLSFMNRSGKVVAALADAVEAGAPEILIFFDDIALPLGTLRIRERGGDGGHRGLASILEALGRQELPRVRLGIRPGYDDPGDLSEFVLAPFSPEERLIVGEVLERSVAAARAILRDGMAKAMSLYNATPCSS